MNSDSRFPLTLLALGAMVPALFLSACGLLQWVFGLDAARQILETSMHDPFTKYLLSPAVALGGPAFLIVVQILRLCRLSASVEHGYVFFGFSIRVWPWNLCALLLGIGILALLLGQGFFENFRVVAR